MALQLPNPVSIDADGRAEPAASAAVRRFLCQHGVREHNHASEIARIIQVDRSQSYRRLKGEVAWSTHDLRAIARHFNAAEETLILPGDWPSPIPPASPPPAAAQHASVCVPGLPPFGWLVPGPVLEPTHCCDLVALQTARGWEVRPDGPSTAGLQRHLVESLTLRCPPHLRVALLEDDPLCAEALVDSLRPFGIAARAFPDAQALLTAPDLPGFEAFVLDWLLAEGTAAGVVEAIRAGRAQVPVIVVTGALWAEAALESQLRELSATWNFSTLDKPVRPMNLANALRQLVAAARG